MSDGANEANGGSEVAEPASRLRRSLTLPGAVTVGVSAMVGTGVFVVWTPIAGLVGGDSLLLALAVACVVASLNATTVAHLARRFPEAGGAYAYGRHLLGRGAGVFAGWAFLIGKSGSAVAAALTIGAYLWPEYQRVVAAGVVLLALLIDASGIVRSVRTLAVTSVLVISVLLMWVLVVSSEVPAAAASVETSRDGVLNILAASGLFFVAFAGYARLATLGEEVRHPRRTIPRAMAISLVIVSLVYLAVASVVAPRLSLLNAAASLRELAALTPHTWLVSLVAVAAVLAAGGTVLSLISGMSRTLFAMSDAGDAPRCLARVDQRRGVPVRAQVVIAAIVMALAAVGGIRGALTVSAVSVLSYYAVAHAAALRRPADGATALPRAIPILGLMGCIVLPASLVLSLPSL